MFTSLTAWIQKRTREEWSQWLHEQITDCRIWIQEHPEKAAVSALIVGMVLVLFAKLVVYLVLLAIIAGAIVYFIAVPESEKLARANKFEEPSNTGAVNSSKNSDERRDPPVQ